jgi:hypothetical protein
VWGAADHALLAAGHAGRGAFAPLSVLDLAPKQSPTA